MPEEGISPAAVVAFADAVASNVANASALSNDLLAAKDREIGELLEIIAQHEMRERLMRERVEWLLGGSGRVPTDWHSFEDAPARPAWLYDAHE